MTFKQALDTGGHVKKGEKAHMVVFYKTVEKESENGKKETFPVMRYSNVFHISQIDGIESKCEPAKLNDIHPIQAAETALNKYIASSGVTLKNVDGSNEAFYKPSTDTIILPIPGQFESAEEYYGTAFHETAHSTGHESRLNRFNKNDKIAAFGSKEYSREELTAEITAAMVLNFIGIEVQKTFENSVAYIQSWSRHLREDTKSIVKASSMAQKATDLILNIQATEQSI